MTRATADFSLLDEELARWADAGREISLWWRDDDAVYPSAKLDRLLALTARYEITPLLAVIPAKAAPALAERLRELPVDVAQHGYAHANRAQRGSKSCEFPDTLPRELAKTLLENGRRRMDALFGERWSPIFVPPWNRFAEDHKALLPAAGIMAFSSFGKAAIEQSAGLRYLNTHLDVMRWRPERGFAGTEACLSVLVGELAARRSGAQAPDEPIGLLTHHLVHDEAAWSFLERLCERLSVATGYRRSSAVNLVF